MGGGLVPVQKKINWKDDKVYYADADKVGWQHPVSIQKTGIAPSMPRFRPYAQTIFPYRRFR